VSLSADVLLLETDRTVENEEKKKGKKEISIETRKRIHSREGRE